MTLYRLLIRVAAPLVFVYFLWRSIREPDYRLGWPQRLGYLRPDWPARPLWIHAASVGEVAAIAPLIAEQLASGTSPPIVVSTMTPTGRDHLRDRFGGAVHHAYIPVDTPAAVRRFLERLAPRVGVIVEMELWPCLLQTAHRREVPLLLANARLSARSLQRYRRCGRLFRRVLEYFAWIGAQTIEDAERLRTLGAPPDRIQVCGNIKFDQAVSASAVASGRSLRRRLGIERPVWVAASTHEGEEIAALQAHRAVCRLHPDAVLLLVPRHPQRFDTVAALIGERGLAGARRTTPDSITRASTVVLGDTMGELPAYIAASDVAFVGGSLAPIGGHNLLEPAALGLPVLCGPHTHNFQEISQLLEMAGALIRVDDAAGLGDAVGALLSDAPRRRRLGNAAGHVVEANRGAKATLLATINHSLGAR